MKIILQTLALTLAALLVVGATIAFGQSELADTLAMGDQPSALQSWQPAESVSEGVTQALPTHDMERESGIGNAIEIVKNLGVIAAITLAITAVTNVAGWFRSRRSAHRAPPTPAL